VNRNAQAVVCVTASPDFRFTKSASPTTATPGQEVTYTIRVDNVGTVAGSVTFVDDYDNRLSPTTPAGCTANTPAAGSMTCTTGTIAAGGSETFTYKANMPATFTGAPGGDGCTATPGQYPVKNVIVNRNAQAVVCVTASPDFRFTKSASPTTATPGQEVTYTIRVDNVGTAAGSVTFVDDYDDRLSPTTPAGCTNGVPAVGSMTCTTGSIAAGGSQTFTYKANMPATFTGAPGGDGCTATPGQYPVKNVIVNRNAQAVVCVTAAPRFEVTKTASKATAVPGEEITYTIKVDNVGPASGATTAVDTYDSRVTLTVVPAGCTDNATEHKLSCTTGALAPLTGTQNFVYKATMPATFEGPSGGSGCQPGQYPVVNTVVVPGDSDTETVCVTATPNLVLSKSADAGSVEQGHLITYTLTLQNTGKAEASGTTIVEDIPTGTAYESCTQGCQPSGSPVNRATWSIGGLKAGQSVVVQLVVRVTTNEACQICNTAKVASPDVNGGVAVSSNTVCLQATPSDNPAGANTNGRATGLQITSHGSGLIGINTSPISYSETSQSGVGGPKLDDETVLSAEVSALGIDLVRANALRTTSSSTVSAVTNDARSTSTAEVLGVCLVYSFNKCTVESSTVRAVASTTANGKTATYSAAGTWIENLKVAGVPVNVVADQTTTVDLDQVLYGLGSYVKINERVGSVSTAGPNRSDLTVTAIRVHITGTLVLKPIDIVVARATAHSDFPKTPQCPPGPNQSVSGHAFIASLTVDPLLVDLNGVLQGYVAIPPTGGADSQSVASVSVGTTGGILSAKAADTATAGGFTATQSKADSHAQVAGDSSGPACVLRTSPTTCIATATVVRSEAHAVATKNGASSTDTGTQLLDLKVLGVAVNATANGVVRIGNLGFLIINEQFCDNGASLAANCAGAQHTGRTVRTLRLVVNQGNNPFGILPGVELIVAEAHADATFIKA
ncbi:MAG TPA: choice-of-anchor P family protein, partial [Acidimicrobiales bacterium]|nr:choice-of-anchor P family protein [Acidimicrobiales bacterium]